MIKTPITLTRITTSIMSLLDNKKGLTILSALFLLFACEEPNELPLGISPKQGTISSHYIEIPVEATQIRIDEVMSSLSTKNSLTYIGKMSDPFFGTVKATAYTNIGALKHSEIPVDINENTEVDSAIISLNYSNSFLGSNISAPQTLKVYSLDSAIYPTSAPGVVPVQFKYNTKDARDLVKENAELIGEVTFDTSMVKNRTLRFHISKDFATSLLDKVKEDTATISNQELFNKFIGSIAIEAGENNTFLNNYNLTSASSNIEIHYSTANGKKMFSFPFAQLGKVSETPETLPIYYSLETDYSGTALEGIESIPQNTPFQTPDNQVYFRAGVGLLPKISFPALEEFVNSNINSNVVINSAVLEVDSVQRRIDTNLPAPPQFSFYLVEDENNSRLPKVMIQNIQTYMGGQMLPQPYVSTQKEELLRYKADIATEIETFINLFKSETSGNEDSKEESRNYLQGMFYNGFSANNNPTPLWALPNNLYSVVADPNHIVLKIYYTTLEKNQGN